MIREREEILEEIHSSPFLEEQFEKWTQKQQKEFLDICTGVKGVKILYDTFFKEIMDPEYRPERLNRLLSLLLGKSVEVEVMLQNDSPRIAGEKTLLSMDLVRTAASRTSKCNGSLTISRESAVRHIQRICFCGNTGMYERNSARQIRGNGLTTGG